MISREETWYHLCLQICKSLLLEEVLARWQVNKDTFNDTGGGEVYLSHPSFVCYQKDRFIANLANLKQALRIERAWVVQEEEEFGLSLPYYPRGKVTSRVKLFWDTHPGNALLKVDIAEDKVKNMKPAGLRLTRAEYQDFNAKDFASTFTKNWGASGGRSLTGLRRWTRNVSRNLTKKFLRTTTSLICTCWRRNDNFADLFNGMVL